METTTTQPLDNPTPPHPSHGHFHTGQRLRKLLRPNGRRVHIAATPEEQIRLMRFVDYIVISFALLPIAKETGEFDYCLLLPPVSSPRLKEQI